MSSEYSAFSHYGSYITGCKYRVKPESDNSEVKYNEHFTNTRASSYSEYEKTMESKGAIGKGITEVLVTTGSLVGGLCGAIVGTVKGVGKIFDLENPLKPVGECVSKGYNCGLGGVSRFCRHEYAFYEKEEKIKLNTKGFGKSIGKFCGSSYNSITDLYTSDEYKENFDEKKYPIFKKFDENLAELKKLYEEPIMEVDFEEKFEYTKFHRLYMKTERFPPINETIEDLKKILPDKMYISIDKFVSDHKNDPVTAIMHIWTQWTAVTLPINFALMIDSYQIFKESGCDIEYIKSNLTKNLADSRKHLNYFKVLEYSIKFIRSVNYCIVRKCTVLNTEKRKTHRGVCAVVYKNVKEGDTFRTTSFCCTSDDLETPKAFSGWNDDSVTEKTLIHFTIPEGCFNAGKISGYACDDYKHQNETLIPPYTCCKLIERKGNELWIEVCRDNKAAEFEKISS